MLRLVQFTEPKGTLPHRTPGWIWVLLMLAVSVSSFYLHGLRVWGPWSPIHLLSVFTPLAQVYAMWAARHHRIRGHRIAMIAIFCGALVIAAVFTPVPGRLMHAVVFGPR